jgi:hypothetical protein
VDPPAEFRRPAAIAAALGARDVAIADDPFARAEPDRPDLRVLLACSSQEVTPTILARRDPDAPVELSSAYAPEPTVDPFADALRRTRTHALALGGAAGAAVGALCAAAIALVALRPWSPAVAETPAPTGGVSVAQLSSHRGPERSVAARRAPARAAGPSLASVTPQPRAAVAPAPPAPSPAEPAVAARGRGAIAPASLESRSAPERVDAAATEPVRRETLAAPDAPTAPAEQAEATVEDAPAAAPADAPPLPDEPAASPAAAVEAPADAPADAPAREP